MHSTRHRTATRAFARGGHLVLVSDISASPAMNSAPKTIGGANVICYTPIDERHRFTGKTKQIVAGGLLGAMGGLAICQYPPDDAFYVFGCDSNRSSITDTWHQTVQEAKEQAEFEYEGVTRTWIQIA
jgi:hypothetical protein